MTNDTQVTITSGGQSIDTTTGEITEIADMLARPSRDLALMDTFVPEKKAVLALWNATDAEMAGWDLETFVSSAETANSLADFSHWIVGRLARGVVTAYGKDSLGEFAKLIKTPRSSVAVYRWVAEQFKDYPDSDLMLVPYSFYQLAAGTDSPMDWVLRASNEDWTYDKLKYEIDVASGKITDDEGDPLNKPKVIKCEQCGGWRIINTDAICGGHKDALEALEDEN